MNFSLKLPVFINKQEGLYFVSSSSKHHQQFREKFIMEKNHYGNLKSYSFLTALISCKGNGRLPHIGIFCSSHLV